VLLQPIESEDVNKYTVISKVCTIFLVKISGNYPEIEIYGNFPEICRKIGINFRKFAGGKFRTYNPTVLPRLSYAVNAKL